MAHVHLSIGGIAKAAMSCGAIGLLCFQPIRTVRIVGRSMEPTYASGSFQLTLPVKKGDLRRGDVVVIGTKNGSIVKRITMLPGDRFYQIKSCGHWLDLIGLHPQWNNRSTKNIYRETQVPPNSIYVLGDNAALSLDSRSFGFVNLDLVESRLVSQHPSEG